MIQEVFTSALEAIAKAKQRLDGLESELSSISSELNTFEGEYVKEVKLLQEQINNQTLLIDRLVKEAIDKIPIPKDGENGVDGKDSIVDYQYILSQIPTPKDGIDGQDGKSIKGDKGDKGDGAIVDYELLKEFIMSNLPKAIKGDKGADGKDGADGVGIESITENLGDIVIKLTDGTIHRIKIPKFISHGNNIIKPSDATELIYDVSTHSTLKPESQVVLVNAIGGNINITLPEPSLCFNSNRSYRIAVNKIDTSTNTVTILPFGSELICGDINQQLLFQSEVLNFITNGTHWYLNS